MARTAGSHSDITGPRIEKAAASLIARHGYAAVSMRQIAAEVGVQAGALYNYTSDKQSLLLTLMRQHMVEVLDAYEDPAHLPPMERLEYFVRFHIDQHRHRTDQVFIAYMELRNLTEENFAEIEALRRAYEGHLISILRDGVAAGVFDVQEPKVTAWAVIAMLNGVNTWFRDGGPLTLEDISQIYWDMIRNSVTN